MRLKLFIKNEERGVALIFAMVITSLILSISFALSAIFIPKLKISTDVKDSTSALYAADSGLEWCLYVSRKAPGDQPSDPVFASGASVTIEPADCSSSPIKATGKFNKTYRALEVSF